MVEFTSTFMEQQAALEKVLQRLFVVDGFAYGASGEKKNEAMISSAHVLPLVTISGNLCALYARNETIVEAPTGFLRQKSFAEKEYYHLKPTGDLEEVNSPSQEILYLSLEVTTLGTSIGDHKEGKFYPFEGAPFSIYGIRNFLGQLRPLVLATETETGTVTKGIYCLKSKLASYNHTLENKDKVSELLQAVKRLQRKEFKIEPIE